MDEMTKLADEVKTLHEETQNAVLKLYQLEGTLRERAKKNTPESEKIQALEKEVTCLKEQISKQSKESPSEERPLKEHTLEELTEIAGDVFGEGGIANITTVNL